MPGTTSRQPLSNARDANQPAFAVYSDHAVIEDRFAPGTPTASLTGSSVAALVVSATAAAAAHYRPGLALDTILED